MFTASLSQHAVSTVTFQSGTNVEEMVKLRTVEIESRSAGWINCPVTGNLRKRLVLITVYLEKY